MNHKHWLVRRFFGCRIMDKLAVVTVCFTIFYLAAHLLAYIGR